MSGRVRILFVVGLAVLLALAMFLLPRDRSGRETRQTFDESEIPRRDTGHGVLLVFDAQSMREGRTPDDDDPPGLDLEWESILRHRFGGCDLLAAAELSADPATALAGRQIAVLSRAASRRVSPSLRPRLESVMQREGTMVLLETPDSTWTADLGLRIATLEGRTRLPWPTVSSGPRLAGAPFLLSPRPAAFEHRAWRYVPEPRSIRERTVPALSIAGRPELWRRDVGSGGWIVLALDLTRLVRDLRVAPPDTVHRWRDAWIDAVLDDAAAVGPWPAVVGGADEGAGPRLRWRSEGERLDVQIDVSAPGQSLRLPFEWRRRRLVDWESEPKGLGFERDWEHGRPTRTFLLPPQGAVELRAIYRHP